MTMTNMILHIKHIRAQKDLEILEVQKGSGSSDSGGSHNEGRNCLSCHSFASAGTVFTNLHASNNTPGAAGYRIKLSTGVVYRLSKRYR